MKLHYFQQEQADRDDLLLGMAKLQGYVPKTCLLGGETVFNEIKAGRKPCAGCNGPREKCRGKPAIPSNQRMQPTEYGG